MVEPTSPGRQRPPLLPGPNSLASTSTASILISDAPTPNNTYFSPDASARDSDDGSSTKEMIHDDGGGDVSLRPSLTPTSTSTHPGLSSRVPSTFSSHASSYLLPTPSSTSFDTQSIPFSTRPVPAPPLSFRSSNKYTSATTDLTTPTLESAPPSIAIDAVKLGDNASDLEASTSRGSRGGGFKQEDVDAQRLQQLGYDAVLGRDYTFWSSLSISWLNIGCLQGTIYAVSGVYSYGGPAMILVAWPLSGIFSLFLTLTLSELASAYPVSGAMASWAWKCARGGVGGERGWGWLMGGVVLGGHAASVILVIWEICNITAGTMSLSFEYQRQSWHLVLFFLATLLLCGFVGSTARGRSHRFWLVSGAYGFCIWLVLCITLVATGATKPGGLSISSRFYNDTGWSSKPYVYLLGWQYTTIASGVDASAHMAEETQKPSRNVPNAMTAAMALTYVLGYISIVLLLLSINPADAAVIATHNFPVGYILENAISLGGAITICCLLIFALLLQVMAQLQASSRFVFALARDNALPFSETIRWTNSQKQPIIANWAVVIICMPFACLLISGQGTLYSVLAVTSSTLSYVGYIVPVTLYLWSGKDLQLEGRTSWSLRRWSKPVGTIGVLFGVLVIIVQTLPGSRPVTAATLSWSPVVLTGTAVICFVTWKCYGDNHYSGPIRALTKWQTGVEIDLQTTLASRSGAVDLDVRRDRETESSIKLGITPYLIDLAPIVTVGSARTIGSRDGEGEWQEGTGWTSATGTEGTESTITRETVSRPGWREEGTPEFSSFKGHRSGI